MYSDKVTSPFTMTSQKRVQNGENTTKDINGHAESNTIRVTENKGKVGGQDNLNGHCVRNI
jgi:hypothetical protein